MNDVTGTAHLTRDSELVTTSGGTEVCQLRVAVKRAARAGEAGYFDFKAFGSQASACAQYLSTGREVALEARLRFEDFETKDGAYAQRLYLIADQVEFLASRQREGRQDQDASSRRSPPLSRARGGRALRSRPAVRGHHGRVPRHGTRQPAVMNSDRLEPTLSSGCFSDLASDFSPGLTLRAWRSQPGAGQITAGADRPPTAVSAAEVLGARLAALLGEPEEVSRTQAA